MAEYVIPWIGFYAQIYLCGTSCTFCLKNKDVHGGTPPFRSFVVTKLCFLELAIYQVINFKSNPILKINPSSFFFHVDRREKEINQKQTRCTTKQYKTVYFKIKQTILYYDHTIYSHFTLSSYTV